MTDWLEAVQLPPGPDGALQLLATCYVDESRSRGSRHPITLDPDWNLTTPHDLEAERVTTALGGFLSCLELPDLVVPAVRTLVHRLLRAEVPPVRRAVDGRWLTDHRVASCCGALAWRGPQNAARHVRSVRHVAAEFGAQARAVTGLTSQVLKAYGITDAEVSPPEVLALAGRCVPSRIEASELWQAGLSAVRIEAMHAAMQAEKPLSVAFYLGVLSRRPDLTWVRETALAVPDRADEGWLAWTETPLDRAQPELRRTWLALGAARADIAVLSDSPYAPREVQHFARLLRTSPTFAANILSSWVTAGVTPELGALVRVCQDAPSGPLTLNRGAVDGVVDSLRREGWDLTREEAAFMLTICGSPAISAAVAERLLSLEPRDIKSALDDWNELDRTANRRGSLRNA